MINLDRYVVDTTTGCHLWAGYIDKGGYGRASGKSAHRLVWERDNGPIPDGLQLDHKCRVRHCINAAHLEPVTQRENIIRGVSFAAVNAAKSHCIHGHALDGDNLNRTSIRRRCRACNLEAVLRYKSKARSAG